MQRAKQGVKAWSLMAAVAIVAVVLAAARPDSAPGAAVAIVGACIAYLAFKTYAERISLRQAQGLSTSRWLKICLGFSSSATAILILGLSDLAFLIGYFGFLKIASEVVVSSHWTPYADAGYMLTGGLFGMIFALVVASTLRRRTRSQPDPDSSRPRRWAGLWPIGLVLLLGAALVAEELRQRYSFCRMMAEYHAGPEAKADGLANAATHAWLKQWYERAAIRPWLPIHPSQVPTGMK
ncbi:hypothetical protein ACYOEI_12475 [Singulisphaera rosea]